MRVTFLEPLAGKAYAADVVQDALGLVIEQPPLVRDIERWNWLERALAYDWAMREHLAAAGNPIRRRDRPTFVIDHSHTFFTDDEGATHPCVCGKPYKFDPKMPCL